MVVSGENTRKANLVLRNGIIWTGAPGDPRAEALAVGGERIIAVGTDEEIRNFITPRTRIIDLKGKLALPGFIDGHTHFLTGGFQRLTICLRDAQDEREFARRIGERAKSLAEARWLTGGEWDHERWPSAALPRKELIDPVTLRTPVFVTRLDMHSALANSLALRLAGITKETPDPPGGEIMRDPVTNEPTGILKDAAMNLVQRVIPAPSQVEADDALRAALREAARRGVTSIQDITLWSDWRVYERFHERGELTVRIYARTPITEWERQRDQRANEGIGDEWLRLGGVKGFVDGSLGSTTALFFQPYTDTPESCGLLHEQMFPEGFMKQRIADADNARLPVSVHAIGDKANQILLNIYEQVIQENGLRDRRFRIEHAQHLQPEDIPRFAKLGIIASMQPSHAIDDAHWAEKRLGPGRCKTAYAFRSLLDAGTRIAFGSDWNVAPLHPLLGIYAAVTRRPLNGEFPQGWVPEQRISVKEAVRAYTVTGAYAEFAEKDKGSLEVGKLADIVVLSENILSIKPHEFPGATVVYTIVGGKVVYG